MCLGGFEVEVEDAGWPWPFSAAGLLGAVKPVNGEAKGLEISAEEVPECLGAVYVEAWGFEISASPLLVVVEVEDVGAWHLQAAFAVRVPVGEEVEYIEALHVGSDFAVGLFVSVELEDVEAWYSEVVAERSGDAEVEDVELYSEAASVVGFPEGVEAVNVETLH